MPKCGLTGSMRSGVDLDAYTTQCDAADAAAAIPAAGYGYVDAYGPSHGPRCRSGRLCKAIYWQYLTKQGQASMCRVIIVPR